MHGLLFACTTALPPIHQPAQQVYVHVSVQHCLASPLCSFHPAPEGLSYGCFITSHWSHVLAAVCVAFLTPAVCGLSIRHVASMRAQLAPLSCTAGQATCCAALESHPVGLRALKLKAFTTRHRCRRPLTADTATRNASHVHACACSGGGLALHAPLCQLELGAPNLERKPPLLPSESTSGRRCHPLTRGACLQEPADSRMQRNPREAVRLRLRQGLDLPLELIKSPLLRELFLRRYLRHSPSEGCWRCTLCASLVKGTHIAVHTCLPTTLPVGFSSPPPPPSPPPPLPLLAPPTCCCLHRRSCNSLQVGYA